MRWNGFVCKVSACAMCAITSVRAWWHPFRSNLIDTRPLHRSSHGRTGLAQMATGWACTKNQTAFNIWNTHRETSTSPPNKRDSKVLLVFFQARDIQEFIPLINQIISRFKVSFYIAFLCRFGNDSSALLYCFREVSANKRKKKSRRYSGVKGWPSWVKGIVPLVTSSVVL